MTTKTDLPPLPERFDCTNGSAQWCYGCYTMTRDDLGDYVLAEDYDALRNASEALQAEIEALRAEVGELHMSAKRRDQYVAEKAAQAADAIARADKLAEALRGWWKAHRPVGWTEDQHLSCPHVNLATDAEKALATALLRDQEEGK